MFTRREKEIISLITEAKCRKTIANELNISIHTIDTHLRNIYLKTVPDPPFIPDPPKILPPEKKV